VALSAIFDLLPGSSLPSSVVVHEEWPSKSGRSFWGAVYNLAWQLDEEISRVYQNEKLWK
jgi:hypothetical protein